MSDEVLKEYDNQHIALLEPNDSAREMRLARLLALCGSISDEDAAIMLEASKDCRKIDYEQW